MLGLFEKKKDSVVPLTPPITDAVPQAFETGKEVQFKDPKTGEFVYQRALSADQRKFVMDAMQKNAQLANQFIGVSRQVILAQEQAASIHKSIMASEQEINKAIQKVLDDEKLDKRWRLNFQLGLIERRDPPSG